MPEWPVFAFEVALGLAIVGFRRFVVGELYAWHRRTWGRWQGPPSRSAGKIIVTGVGLGFILFGASGLLRLDPTIPFLVLFVGMLVLSIRAGLRELR